MRISLLLPLFGILVVPTPMLQAQVSSDPTENRLGISRYLASLTQDDAKKLSERALAGDPEAQYWLGMLYEDGQLVPKDKTRADSLFLQSAEHGYPPAEFQVGIVSYPSDIPKAERWMLAAARHGNAEAQFWLGATYEQRWFGITDLQEAAKWYKLSAEQGHPDAQASLGLMYENGDGVKQDYVTAAEWYLKAAEHDPDLGGAGQGRNQLGLLYLQGLGVPQDYVQAYKWLSIAHNESDSQYVQSLMTPAQIERARRMVLDWKQRHPQSPETTRPAEYPQQDPKPDSRNSDLTLGTRPVY
jgi:TPR repeat protein